MLREIVEGLDRNPVKDFIVDLLDFNIDPNEYDQKVKELEKKYPDWWKSIPNQGGANFTNSVNYSKAYDKHRRKGVK